MCDRKILTSIDIRLRVGVVGGDAECVVVVGDGLKLDRLVRQADIADGGDVALGSPRCPAGHEEVLLRETGRENVEEKTDSPTQLYRRGYMEAYPDPPPPPQQKKKERGKKRLTSEGAKDNLLQGKNGLLCHFLGKCKAFLNCMPFKHPLYSASQKKGNP